MPNWGKLVSQGRAKAHGVAWSDAETAAIQSLIDERGITRLAAADYVRNGITSVEDFDKAKTVEFKPKTRAEADAETAAALQAAGQEAIADVVLKDAPAPADAETAAASKPKKKRGKKK